MSRRMSTSALVQTFREAVCPQTLAADEDGAEEGASDGITLSDALLVDGTASLRRLTRRFSVGASSKKDLEGAPLTRRLSSTPPPPPPPLPLTDEVLASIEAAQLRQKSSAELADTACGEG